MASFPRIAVTLVCGLSLSSAACDVDVPLIARDTGVEDSGFDPEDPDAGTLPRSEIIEAQEVQEDFENRSFVDPTLSEHVIIDTNRGVATLAAERFPSLEASTIANLVQTTQFEGVVEASTILLEPDVQIDAVDAIELRAADTLRISGRLRAGPGGVTLVAGESLFVDGSIESLGPIRLRLASEDGVMEVSGALLTNSVRSGQSAEISLVGRGPVELSGEVRTGEGELGSGSVLISSYRDIHVNGAESVVASGATSAGPAGSVRLLSEGNIQVTGGALLSTGRPEYEGLDQLGPGTGGGDIELRAVSDVQLSGGARLLAGSHEREAGGTLRLIAGDELDVVGVNLEAGGGGAGGAIYLEARTATIGPEVAVLAGSGQAGGGEVEIAAAHQLHLQASSARAGGAECGMAGSVRIHVGGLVTVGPAVMLFGGAGGRSMNRCLQGGQGGDVIILVREGEREALVQVSTPGYGGQNGERSVTIDPSYERPMPDVRVRTSGALVSRIIDRGESAMGLVPRLLSFLFVAPPETFAKVQLSGAATAEGPFEPWLDASLEDAETLHPLEGARYFRYRLLLQGRALDAPEVDAFELDLAAH